MFAGDRTLQAAESVAADGQPSGDVAVTLDGLEALADNGLVQQHPGGGEVRWTMLETVRELALELLQQTDEVSSVRRRHARFFLALAESDWRYDPAWIERLATELNNLRAALAWCKTEATRLDGGAAAELGVQLCGAVAWF